MEERWLESQLRRCTKYMEASLSATHLRMERPGFGQTIIPRAGSVLASPVYAHWDPEPDYFFHWLRDSALVMDAITLLSVTAGSREERQKWNRYFQDFVRFSHRISQIEGADFKESSRAKVTPEYMQWVRPAEEMVFLRGDLILAEPRVNADGTPDFQKWSRPQYDGPALRALTCLRHWEKRQESQTLRRLIEQDLDFTAAYADKKCIGPWEEEFDQHYYTSVVQLGALHHGAAWARSVGDSGRAACYDRLADVICQNLDLHWDDVNGFYRTARHKISCDPEDDLDIAVVIGIIHARLPEGRHSIQDDRVAATLRRIESLFEKELPINHNRAMGTGLATGRYKKDTYQGGGGWYFSTLAVAEYNYKRGCVRQGDEVMNLIRKVIPEDGSLSEQFDRVTGEPRSARHLTWSYAAFITAAFARRQALKLTHMPKCREQPHNEP